MMRSLNSRSMQLFFVLGGATTFQVFGCGTPVYEIPHGSGAEESRGNNTGGALGAAQSRPVDERAGGGESPTWKSESRHPNSTGGAAGAAQSHLREVTEADDATGGRSTSPYAEPSAGEAQIDATVFSGVAGASALEPCGGSCDLPHAVPDCADRQCAVGQCQDGWADCNDIAADGCEANLQSDPLHCGACDSSCSAAEGNATCNDGQCSASCASGSADCDGACEGPCAPPDAAVDACTQGQCAVSRCDPGRGDCNQKAADGCEADLNTDLSNCGACGVVCRSIHGKARCDSGTCKLACASGYANCDGNPSNGCETDTLSNVEHCGGCSKTCEASCEKGTCGATPCSGLCEDPTVITVGSGAVTDIAQRACHESYQATKAFVSGNCGQLDAGRRLYVNGVEVNCDTLPWEFSATGKPLPRNGGYCFHDDQLGSNGDYAWFNVW